MKADAGAQESKSVAEKPSGLMKADAVAHESHLSYLMIRKAAEQSSTLPTV
jgi:hypothetical protein